jgi:hypothetical protein
MEPGLIQSNICRARRPLICGARYFGVSKGRGLDSLEPLALHLTAEGFLTRSE